MGNKGFLRTKVFFTLFLLVSFLSSFSQTGTVFWATAPYSTPSHDGNHTIHVVVSSMASPATVTLSIPANPSFTPITINLSANSTDYFDFNSLMLPLVEENEWDQITNKGILIESTDVITAYLEVFSTYNSDIFALKGKNGLGTDFYAPFETTWGNHDFGCTSTSTGCVQAFSSVNIVATENNTTVWITPSVDVYKNSTGVHAAGVPYSVILNKGQTFTVRAADIKTTAQPAGTHITSDKPIAVTISDDSMQIGSAYDIVGDQLVPVNVEGSQYIAMKGYLTDEYVYGVISENTTKISINGTLRTKTYNKGDTIIVKLSTNTTVIQSDNKQKFNIFHVSGKADEAGGAILPPTDQCSGSMQVGFNFGHADKDNYLYLNLMCRAGAESSFLVDGVVATWLTPSSFTPVSGTSWSVARFTLTNVDLAKGNHVILNTKDFFHMGYINYTGPGSEYGYFSDFEKLDVAAVAIKSNSDTAVACTGEELQLRVDGGVNYVWTGKNTITNADASMYLSSKTIYNPKILGTIPTGFYSFTVNVSSACNGPVVSKTIKVHVVQSPADQVKSIDICESEVGSGCVSSLDLTKYSNLMTNNWPTGVVTKWEKDGYNEMVMFDNYDGIRVVNYGTKNAKTFNMAFANPLPTSPVNASATVLKFEVGGGSTGKFTLNNQADYPFDINNGAIFKMKVMNTVYSSWSANAYRSVTMRLIYNTDTAAVTTALSKFDKWEELTFDFSALPKKNYNTIEITLNGKDYEQDVFYIDDIQKMYSYRKMPIPNPTSTPICNPAKVYALIEDANGCSANSVLTPNVKPGSFAVSNPAVTLCQTGSTAGEATGVNFTSYISNITNNVAGLSITRWDKTFTNYDSVYENFDNVTGNMTWNTPQKVDGSGNSLGTTTLSTINTLNNTKSALINNSAKMGAIYSGGCNGYMISSDLTKPIDLSQGWIFKLMASYETGQWSNGSTSTQSVKMTLSGSSGTVSVGPTSIHRTSSNNTGVSDSNHIWTDLTFDFSTYKTQKGFDRISIYFFTSNYGVDSFFFDNFHRIMQPFLAPASPTNQTVQNGEKVYAIVKDANGCLVKSTITFTVKDCGPPAIDQVDTMCEASVGSGNVTAINLTNYNNAIKGGIATNTVTWYSNATLTTAVPTPTSVTITNGLTFYALVKDPANGKQDTATLTFTIKALPNIVFPTISPVCEGSASFNITGTTPSGGTWTVDTYIGANGDFDPNKAVIGTNNVTYNVTTNGCTNAKTTTVTVNPNPVPSLITATKDLVYCGTAGVKVDVTNITGATYTWAKEGTTISGTTSTQNGLTAGTYSVTVDLNGCQKAVSNIVVTGHEIPEYTITGGGKYCDDTIKKQDIIITLTKGEKPWNVYYNNGTTKWGQTAVSANSFTVPTKNLAAGTYVLDSLTDAYCKALVKSSLSATLTEVKRPTTNLQTTDLDYCGTASDVTLTIAAFSPCTYQWKQGSTVVGSNSNSFANAPAGTYSVTLTNDICQYTLSNIIVTAYSKPSYNFTGGGTFCAGKAITPVSLTLTGKSPWNVTYRIDGTEYPVTISASPYTITQKDNGTYDIKSITDANTCVGDLNTGTNGSANIVINTLPIVTFAYVDSICESTPTIDLSSKVSPKTGGTGVFSGSGVNPSSGLFTHSGPKSYALQYTFTDGNGCVDSAKRSIKVNENPISSITPDPAAICISNDLTLDGKPSKGTSPYTQLWTDVDAISISSKTAQTITINTPNAKTYSLAYTVTDKNGCTGTDNISVTVNALPNVSITAPKTTLCRKDAAITLSGTGNSGTWSPNTIVSSTGSFDPQDADVTEDPSKNTITYTYTDGNGCINSASIDITIIPMPSVTLTGNTTACIYDGSFKITPNLNGGTFTSSTGKGIDANGNFSPSAAGTGTTIITYDYSTAEGCKDSKTHAVVVSPKPKLSILNNPETVCQGNNTITINANPSGGTFTGLGINTTGTFDPKASVSLNTAIPITYAYTDGITGCKNDTTFNITVNQKPIVSVGSKSSLINTALVALVGVSDMTAGTYTWYDSTGAAKGTGANFIPSTVITDNSKVSKHTLTYTHTSDDGCVSDAVQQTYTLFNCPAPQPTPADNRKCIDDAAKQPSISASANGTGTLYWFAADNAKMGTELATGTSLNTAKTAAGTYTYYVAEYDAVNTCFGPTAVANLIIDPLPIVDISIADSILCYNEKPVNVTVNQGLPSGPLPLGVITGSTALSGTSFNPEKLISDTSATTTATTTLTYTYTDIHGCKNSDVLPMTVHFTKHPTPTDAQYLLSQIQSGTQPNLTVAGNTGATFNWYTNNAMSGTPTQGSVFNTGLSNITAMTGTNYWVSQTVNGCESQPSIANIKIVLCPTPLPLVKNESVCENVAIPNLTATGTKLNWYDSPNGATTVATEGTLSFSHGKTAPNTYTYYVSQKLIDPTTSLECEGPRQAIKLIIWKKPTISITNTTTLLCIDNNPISITTTSDVSGTGIFAESFLTNVSNSKADLVPQKAGVGSHTINYTFTDNNGCIETTNQAIVIDSTPAPSVAPLFEDMVHNPKPQMTATGTAIKWYTKSTLGSPLGNGSPFVDPTISETDVITKDYWVTQTLNGCESQPSKTQVKIDACPVPQAGVDKNNFKRCTYDNAPSITANSGTNWPMPPSSKRGFYWYTSQSAPNAVYVGNPFIPTVSGQQGVQTYYVAEYDSLYTCFGARQKVTFTIVPVAAPDVVPVNDICQGFSNPTFTIQNPISGNRYLWYGTADTLGGKLFEGTNFKPVENAIGLHTYYVSQTDENACHSIATSTQFTIKLTPARPVLTPDATCAGENTHTLTATGLTNASFEWYKNDSTHWVATSATLQPAITSTTTYYVRQNVDNCRSWFDTVTYTIKPIPPTPSASSKAICPYLAIPTFAVTATGLVNWYDQTNNFINNNNPFTPSQKVNQDYYISQTVNGCESPKKKVVFTVYPMPAKPVVNDGMRICETKGNASVTAKSGNNWKWYQTNDTTTSPLTSGLAIYTFKSLPFGEYHIFVTQTDANKCQSEPTDAVVFVDSIPAKPIINEKSVAVCEYENIPTFSVSNSNPTITWMTDTKTVLGSGNSFTPSKSQLKVGESRLFMVQVTSPKGCTSPESERVGVLVKKTPAVPLVSISTVCAGDTSIISFKGKADHFTLYDPVSKDAFSTDSSFQLPVEYTSNAGSKTFAVYQTINGCDGIIDSVTLNTFNRPTPLILGKDSLCENSKAVIYTIAKQNKENHYDWSVTGNRIMYKAIDLNSDFYRAVDWEQSGIDVVTVTEDNGYCIGTASKTVYVATKPSPNFTWDIPGGLTTVNFNNTTTQDKLTGNNTDKTIGMKSFYWYFHEQDQKPYYQNAELYENNDDIKIPYTYGEHQVKLVAVNDFGCRDSITKAIFIDVVEGLWIPNAFNPSSSSPQLSHFMPKGFNMVKYELSIYDMWGNLIWYTNKLRNGSPAEGWDGKYNGEILKVDTYIWKIEAEFVDGTKWPGRMVNGKRTKFGNVLLLE